MKILSIYPSLEDVTSMHITSNFSNDNFIVLSYSKNFKITDIFGYRYSGQKLKRLIHN